MPLPLLAHSPPYPFFGSAALQKGTLLTLPSLLQAQAILDGRDLPDAAALSDGSERALLQLDLSLLAGLSRALRARREAAGALELASAELRFETDEATGKPMKVITKQVSFSFRIKSKIASLWPIDIILLPSKLRLTNAELRLGTDREVVGDFHRNT
jgi:hypothetical protein